MTTQMVGNLNEASEEEQWCLFWNKETSIIFSKRWCHV